MSFLVVLLTFFLEQKKLLNGLRAWFSDKINQYANLFVKRDFHTVREIRTSFVLSIIPFLLVSILLIGLLYNNNYLIYFIINGFLYMACVDMLGWKEQAKMANPSRDFQQFVQTYATRFFATTFWFLVVPTAFGAIAYLVLSVIGNQLRSRANESMVYSVVVDKMLYWLNLIPYSLLCLLIAAAGDFEEVMRYLIEQRKHFKLSFYYLEQVLNEVAFIAIGKDKFKTGESELDIADLNQEHLFRPEVISYVIALLYRTALFFIGLVSLISIVALLS